MLTAEEARTMQKVYQEHFTPGQIKENIDAAIVSAIKAGKYYAEYCATGRDFFLNENPKYFKDLLKDLGFTVQLVYDQDFRSGNGELRSLRISWEKK
jgi:hypothetical protein